MCTPMNMPISRPDASRAGARQRFSLAFGGAEPRSPIGPDTPSGSGFGRIVAGVPCPGGRDDAVQIGEARGPAEQVGGGSPVLTGRVFNAALKRPLANATPALPGGGLDKDAI